MTQPLTCFTSASNFLRSSGVSVLSRSSAFMCSRSLCGKTSSSTDVFRTRVKRFWSIVSKSQPRAEMTRTTQQYLLSPWYHLRGFPSGVVA